MVKRSDIDSLDAATVLDAAAEARRFADHFEANLLMIAAHFADLHPAVEGTPGAGYGDPALRGLDETPGGERLDRLAGEGTPAIAEFAPDELAVALGISVGQAKALIGEALELRHRLPRLWALVLKGLLQAWKARQVARETIPLSPAAADFVDRHVAVVAARNQLPYLGRLVQEAILRCDPEVAREREEDERRRRGVWINHRRQSATATITAVVDAIDGVAIETRVQQLAGALADLGDTTPLEVRRARALGLLANPQRALWLTSPYPREQAAALASDSRLTPLLDGPLFATLDPRDVAASGPAAEAVRGVTGLGSGVSGGSASGVGAAVYLHLDQHAVLDLVRQVHGPMVGRRFVDPAGGNPVAVEERFGAITLDLLREWLGAVDHVSLRPVLHVPDPAVGRHPPPMRRPASTDHPDTGPPDLLSA